MDFLDVKLIKDDWRSVWFIKFPLSVCEEMTLTCITERCFIFQLYATIMLFYPSVCLPSSKMFTMWLQNPVTLIKTTFPPPKEVLKEKGSRPSKSIIPTRTKWTCFVQNYCLLLSQNGTSLYFSLPEHLWSSDSSAAPLTPAGVQLWDLNQCWEVWAVILQLWEFWNDFMIL